MESPSEAEGRARHMVTGGMCSCGQRFASRREAHAHLDHVGALRTKGARIAGIAVRIVLVVVILLVVLLGIAIWGCGRECFGTGAGAL